MNRVVRVVMGVVWLFAAALTNALGTDAGTLITNTATVSFTLDGATQPIVESATVVTRVDERIDVAVVSDNGGSVLVTNPLAGANASFAVTNTGNGKERFRLVVDTDIDEGGFDPVLRQVFVESNGVPGLQEGAGGDTPYADSANSPLIEQDETIIVHVAVDMPGSLSGNGEGVVRLNAVSATLAGATGANHPSSTSFPRPGDHFDGLGDEAVGAVVGLSHSPTASNISAQATLEVSGPFVSLTKSTLGIDDGQGGSRVVSGAQVIYQLAVRVEGDGTIEDLVLTDALPENMAYVAGSITVDGLAQDDDFLPEASDMAGFVAAETQVSVAIGRLSSTDPERRVTFAATVR